VGGWCKLGLREMGYNSEGDICVENEFGSSVRVFV